MRDEIAAELRESARLKDWAAANLTDAIAVAASAIIGAYRAGGKVAFCGNGGSAADSQHLAAELVGRFRQDRRPYAAFALSTDTSVLTALANDYGYDQVFKRQVEASLGPLDVLVAISTSGRSPNVNLAVEAAKSKGAITVGLSGRDGGNLARLADIPIVVAHPDSPRIQECHIAIGHIICGLVERALSGPTSSALPEEGRGGQGQCSS